MVVGCQVKPTKVTSQQQQAAKEGEENWVLTMLRQQPVILDVRSSLDFGISHAPGAISVRWEDFSRQEPGMRGLLQEDKFSLARRLSLWGIDPNTPVVVLGFAHEGFGEEGRVAWMLKHLGVRNVSIAHFQMVRGTIPREEMPPMNRPTWKPELVANLDVTWKEFQNLAKGTTVVSKARSKALRGYVPKPRDTVFLDVRSEMDAGRFDLASLGLKKPLYRFEWRQFIEVTGKIKASVQDQLSKNGITPNQEIVVIGQRGVESGLVCFVLNELGYRARNFSGGVEMIQNMKKESL